MVIITQSLWYIPAKTHLPRSSMSEQCVYYGLYLTLFNLMDFAMSMDLTVLYFKRMQVEVSKL